MPLQACYAYIFALNSTFFNCVLSQVMEGRVVDFAQIIDFNAIMDVKLAINHSIPIPYDLLKERYRAYGSPKDKVARLVADGELIRLKKGLFLEQTGKADDLLSLGLIANTLRGPSYVSLHTALSFYGMIPERVFAIRSMTMKRSRTYHTLVGRFEYITAKEEYFSIGIRSVDAGEVSFLIASPEKAICDLIVTTPNLRIQSAGAMREYMEEDMRIDLTEIEQINFSIFDEIINMGLKRREIEFLKGYCKNVG